MKLLITLITYNRLEYTKKTLQSLKETIDIPYYLNVVDNNSTDGTADWLNRNLEEHVILNDVNLYPGRATNLGWTNGLLNYPETTHLMRCDNDMEFEEDWASKAAEYFRAFPELGQLGLDSEALDTYNGNPDYIFSSGGKTINMWPGNVGGPCIIKREIWDNGARWDETPWEFGGDGKPIATEDVKFSFLMHKLGYAYGHPIDKLARTFANEQNWKDFPDYYKKTLLERGFIDKYKEVFGDE